MYLYAGIIGLAQGLEVILKAAEQLKHKPELKFILLGSGPVKQELENLKNEKQLNNVYFFDAVQKKDMPSIVKAIDVSIIPLRKLELFLGAIPSKIFESLAMEKPIILGVDGEARELFVNQGKCALFSEPESVTDLKNNIEILATNVKLREQLGQQGRLYVENNFNRDTIANKFYNILRVFNEFI